MQGVEPRQARHLHDDDERERGLCEIDMDRTWNVRCCGGAPHYGRSHRSLANISQIVLTSSRWR